MLIEFLKDTEVDGVMYHAGKQVKLNSEYCRQLIEAGLAKQVSEKPKLAKGKDEK